MDLQNSQIFVTSRFEEQRERLEQECADAGLTLIPIVREGNFKVEDVALTLEKAYLASEEHQVILLAGDSFSEVVQNKLLKVIEEPPPKKSFIFLFRSKASILPTIRSRLPIRILDEGEAVEPLGLDLGSLDLKSVYDFLQEHSRIGNSEARSLVERLLKEALASGAYEFDGRAMDTFRDGVKALDRGSPSSFVLTAVLLKLLAKKRKKTPRRP